ncbi:porin [Marinobacter persicus]|uniref:Porin n=1 Tax=Marinobacter persicus TaxID=930118 RepID=A0A2S6G3X9_9GAMM|nr:porin [Marinobacter persicus]PPK51800.1 putative porin [Marinobacter persicus]PPK53823.1 putative porin [Marinobacter persicus]PPK58731.1 putative porin [Marinobacter persicus]
MKKTVLASAIAAATFSGAAFAQESNMPTVYGNIQYAVTHSDIQGGPSSIEHRDNGSTIGIKHDHEIMPGVSGFFKAELEFDADQKDGNNGLDAFDEAYIGVDSDSFGKIWIGSDDSTYERAIDEIANYYEAADLSIAGSYDTGEGDLIQYATPSFGGFQLHAAVQVNGDGDNGKKSYPYQLAATYNVDALELAVAMDSNDGSLGYSKDGIDGLEVDNGEVVPNEVDSEDSFNNENTYGLRASYNMGDLRLTGQYQTRKDVVDQFGVFAGYTIGANRFAVSYEMAQYDEEFTRTGEGSLDRETVTLQALHNLSDNMYVYAEGYFGGGDDVYKYEDASGNNAYSNESTVAAVGAVYYF